MKPLRNIRRRRYATPPETYRGISWKDTILGVTAVGIAHCDALEFFKKNRGVSDRHYIRDHWPELVTGFFGRAHTNDLADRLEFLLPELMPFYQKKSTHKGSFGRVLLGRAEHSITKNEIHRLDNPVWKPLFEQIRSHVSTNTPLTVEELAYCNEQCLAAQVVGEPGVYIRVDPLKNERFYFGEAGSVSDRNHSNAHHRLAAVVVTQTKAVAKCLESNVFKLLDDFDYVDRWTNPSGSCGRRGGGTMASGLDPVDIILELIRRHYSHLAEMEVVGLL